MAARLIDGRAAALELRSRIAQEVERFRAETGRAPGLATVLVGEDPASAVYVRSKGKATREAGMESASHQLPADISEAELLALVAQLNADPGIDGILVQLPLPGHIDSAKVIAAIDPAKDVDGFHPINAGKLATGAADALVPCTPLGCLHLLKAELGSLSGMNAVVVGRSNIGDVTFGPGLAVYKVHWPEGPDGDVVHWARFDASIVVDDPVHAEIHLLPGPQP